MSNRNVRQEEYDRLEPWEAQMLWMHQRSFDMDNDTKLLEVTTGEEVPEFVKQYIRDAIDDGALFSDFDRIPSRDLMKLRSVFKDELTTDGWTINSMRDTLMSFAPDLDKFEAERIARTETAAVLNTAREESYVIEYPDAKFYWSGRLDNRTTAACEWLVKTTNPYHGGDPVPLEELKELIEEAPTHDPDMADDIARPDDFVVHPNERKTLVRA